MKNKAWILNNKRKKYKLIDFIISCLVILYVIIRIFFVQFFFPEKIVSGNITYRFNSFDQSKTAIVSQTEVNSFLKEVTDFIKTNPFYDEDIKINICFCDSRRQYAFWNPLTAFKGSLATSTNFFTTHTLMLSDPDFSTMEISYKNKNTRKIKDIILHEATHSFLRKKYNFIKRLSLLPKWKEEGIAEAVAGSSTYDINKGLMLFLKNEKDSSPTFEYFKYRLCILYLQKEKNMDYSQIISSKQKYSEILDEISKYDESSILLWFE